jgi:hypothetical protein
MPDDRRRLPVVETKTPGRVTLLDLDLDLPTPEGVSRSHVTATARTDGSLPVVLVAEDTRTSAVSAYVVFDLVAAVTRKLLRDVGEEPVWIHRWDERALAAVVLRDERITRDHVMQWSSEGWDEWPIPGRLTRALLG